VEGPYSLQDGDRLRLGDYEILVSVDERNDFPSDASGQLPAPPRVNSATFTAGDDLGEELDITDLLSDPVVQAGPTPKHSSKAFALEPQAAQRMAPPAAVAKPARSGFASLLENLDASANDAGAARTVAHGRKPDDWQMQTRPYDLKTMAPLASYGNLARSEPVEARPRRSADNSPHEASSGLEAFCRGAGIDPSGLPADAQNALLTLAGQMLREVVLGLMESLKGRADVKSRLQLSQTGIHPIENNPLKFSASVDEAISKLLATHGSRYLGPVEAIRQSFADLRMHQVALTAAIQGAMDEFMTRIEPGELQERFDRGLKRGSLLGAANKSKYWELYMEFYQALNQRNEQGLPSIFAEELARTYAEKVTLKKK
jgi:type VI secretion system protein